MMHTKHFGNIDGSEILVYNIKSKDVKASVLNYGAVLHKLEVRSKDGSFVDVVGGYEDIDGYLNGVYKHGAVIGRVANRIQNGVITINGEKYQLSLNENRNHIHGGYCGWNKRIWEVDSAAENYVRLKLFDPDGCEGYPGNVKAYVTYTAEDNMLVLDVEAVTDKTTVINVTNHSFFNLNGFESNDIRNHTFKINSCDITLTDENNIPTGEVVSAKGTVYDFTSERKISLPNHDIYDLNYVFADKNFSSKASAYSPATGINMEVLSDMPALQFYTVDRSFCSKRDKCGNATKDNSWFCLEPQYSPDSPNHSNFISCFVEPEQKYLHRVAYKFSIK